MENYANSDISSFVNFCNSKKKKDVEIKEAEQRENRLRVKRLKKIFFLSAKVFYFHLTVKVLLYKEKNNIHCYYHYFNSVIAYKILSGIFFFHFLIVN